MTAVLASLVLLLAVPAAEEKKPASYPRPELLIEAEELAKPEVAAKYRILDVRPNEQYTAGHVPNALRLNVEKYTAPDTEEAVAAVLLSFDSRVTPDTAVVIYGDGLGKEAARAWWLLRHLGLKDVRLLNGGWSAWQAAGGKVSKEMPDVPLISAQFKRNDERLADKNSLLRNVKDKNFQVVDARSTEEYCGETKTAKRSGHVPGAIHLEWSDTLDPKTKKFKSADELTKLFKEAGIDPEKPTITYCQSGARASVMAFALELMGAKDVRNYYKSWAEWGNDPETPIETSKPKK